MKKLLATTLLLLLLPSLAGAVLVEGKKTGDSKLWPFPLNADGVPLFALYNPDAYQGKPVTLCSGCQVVADTVGQVTGSFSAASVFLYKWALLKQTGLSSSTPTGLLIYRIEGSADGVTFAPVTNCFWQVDSMRCDTMQIKRYGSDKTWTDGSNASPNGMWFNLAQIVNGTPVSMKEFRFHLFNRSWGGTGGPFLATYSITLYVRQQ